MPISVKIRGGTQQGGAKNPCYGCKRATIIRGESLDQEVIDCSYVSTEILRISFKVTECNRFISNNHPSIREMEEIAMVLVTDTKKNQIGFVRHKELSKGDQWVASQRSGSDD